MPESEYDEDFYTENEEITRYSPEAVFKIVLSVLDVRSLCDIGGGIGLWMRGFMDLKGDEVDYNDLLCVDGNYVDENKLMIPRQCFKRADLEKPLTWIDRKYDVAMSLEVAEHLSPERADSFVEDLTRLSDVVLFSAAITGQGGTHHVNEQYMSYWVEKFGSHDYRPFDFIRPRIQDNKKIPVWYRQNIIVFAKRSSEQYKVLSELKNENLIHFVHEDHYGWILSEKMQLIESNNRLTDDNRNLNEQLASAKEELQIKQDELNRTNEELKRVTVEFNYYREGFTFKVYSWLKRHIFSRVKS